MAGAEQPVFKLLTPERLQSLRTLNSVLFPVKFHVRAAVRMCAAAATACVNAKPLRVQDQVYKDAIMCGGVTQLGEASQSHHMMGSAAALCTTCLWQHPP